MHGADAVAQLPGRYAFAHRDDAAHRLMTRRHRQRHKGEAARPVDEVAEADAAGLHLDQHLARARVRGGSNASTRSGVSNPSASILTRFPMTISQSVVRPPIYDFAARGATQNPAPSAPVAACTEPD